MNKPIFNTIVAITLLALALPAPTEAQNASNEERSLYLKAELLLEKKKFKEAEPLTLELVKKSPKNQFYRRMNCEVLLELSKWKEANEEAIALINLNPALSYPYFVRAESAYNLKKYNLAKDWYEMYFSLDRNGKYKDPFFLNAYRSILEKINKSDFKSPKGTYLANVLINGNMRWRDSDMPLKVYIKPGKSKDGFKPEYIEYVKNAFELWKSSSQSAFTYKIVARPDKANIKVTFPGLLKMSENVGGFVECQSNSYDASSVKIKTLQMDNRHSTSSDVKMIILHEVGHAIGLVGHSFDPNDSMYYLVQRDTPSQRDINTLKALYNSKPKKKHTYKTTNVRPFSSITYNTFSDNNTVEFANHADNAGYLNANIKNWLPHEKRKVKDTINALKISAPQIYNPALSLDSVIILRSKNKSMRIEPGIIIVGDSFFGSASRLKTMLRQFIKLLDIGNRISYSKEWSSHLDKKIDSKWMVDSLLKNLDYGKEKWMYVETPNAQEELQNYIVNCIVDKNKNVPRNINKKVLGPLIKIDAKELLWYQNYKSGIRQLGYLDYKNAEKSFLRAVKVFPERPETLMRLSYSAMRTKNINDAFLSALKSKAVMERNNVSPSEDAWHLVSSNLAYVLSTRGYSPIRKTICDSILARDPYNKYIYKIRRNSHSIYSSESNLSDLYRAKGFF